MIAAAFGLAMTMRVAGMTMGVAGDCWKVLKSAKKSESFDFSVLFSYI